MATRAPTVTAAHHSPEHTRLQRLGASTSKSRSSSRRISSSVKAVRSAGGPDDVDAGGAVAVSRLVGGGRAPVLGSLGATGLRGAGGRGPQHALGTIHRPPAQSYHGHGTPR